MHKKILEKLSAFFNRHALHIVLLVTVILSVASLAYYANQHLTLAYGDAESHINISKHVISGVTPGFGQLGGVWLPLQHLMMIPFVWNDTLWRTGIGGSLVSVISFVVAAVFIYKIIFLLSKDSFASFLGTLVFITNPNILYLQSTPLGEVPLTIMMILGVYYLLKWVVHDKISHLIFGAFFILCGSLIRYDAWFLIFCSLVVIPVVGILKKYRYTKIESSMILYSTVALAGIFFWLLWNYLIFKNPIYFFASPYSAKSQQMGWMKQGKLPSYHNIENAFLTYTFSSLENVGYVVFAIGVLGLALLTVGSFKSRQKFAESFTLLLVATPYVFYITTLFMGISIIFLPKFVPPNSTYALFNVRYGIMMLPAAAIFIGLLANKTRSLGKILILILFVFQLVLFSKYGTPISLQDGVNGFSARRPGNSNQYMSQHYDYGYLIFDDYSRVANPVSMNISLNKIIYVGNHPYWEDSLAHPVGNVRWIIVRQDENDAVWKSFKDNPEFLNNFQVVYNFENTYVYKQKDY